MTGTDPTPPTTKQTKPIAGALWGVLLGIGMALLALNAKIVSLEILPLVLIVVLGIVLGVLWAMLGPAKSPRGSAPESPTPDPAPPATTDPSTSLDIEDEIT